MKPRTLLTKWEAEILREGNPQSKNKPPPEDKTEEEKWTLFTGVSKNNNCRNCFSSSTMGASRIKLRSSALTAPLPAEPSHWPKFLNFKEKL